MKKVLALVLAVVMVCGLAAISTSAAEKVSLKVTVNGEEINVADGIVAGNGDEVVVEVKNAPSLAAFKVELEKQDGCPDGASMVLKNQDGKKFTFAVTTKITSIVDTTSTDYVVSVVANNDAAKNAMPDGSNYVLSVGAFLGVDAADVVVKENFDALKASNEDAEIKASFTYGEYLTITDVQNAKSVNVETVSAPAALKEALEGKNYVFAGYKYAQELPGVSTMKVTLNASMVLAGAKEVYVYQYNDGKLTLYPSTADNKAWEVKDGAVKFPVSTTAQWVVTDKQLSGSNTNTDTETNPGTGANDMIGAAVVMALVAAAGVVAFKK